MNSYNQEDEGKKKISEVRTFPVPYALEEIQENISISTNTPPKPSEEEIINQALKFHSEGNLSEAAKYYQYFINQGFKDHQVFTNYGNLLKDLRKLQEAVSLQRKAIELNPDFAIAHVNLGNILRDLGKLKDAEVSTRKAIKLKPDLAIAHVNLGNILRDLGKLKDAEVSTRKAIELNPDLATAYFSLSSLQYSKQKNTIWKDKLFSENILNNKSKKDQIDIYFAKANILHKEKNHEDSSNFLELGNQLKLILHPSNADNLINQSKVLRIESEQKEINKKDYTELPESIFIVGMPRSGSTLLESILSMNTNVDDLGESNILKESFLDYKKNNQLLTLAERYWKKIKNHQH